MSQLILEEVVNVSKEKTWKVLVTEFGDVHKWNPNLQGSHFMKGAAEGGLNCERHCDLDGKTFFEERIVDLKEGDEVTIKITSSNFPMVHEMSGTFHLTSLGPNKTQIQMILNVSTKPVIMVHILKIQMKKLLKKSLVGLKYYLETGKSVSDTNFRSINIDYKKLSHAQAFAV